MCTYVVRVIANIVATIIGINLPLNLGPPLTCTKIHNLSPFYIHYINLFNGFPVCLAHNDKGL